MLSLFVFGTTILILFGIVFSAKKWGGAKAEKDHIQNIVEDVVKKKEISHEVNQLSDDDLLSRWIKFVRK